MNSSSENVKAPVESKPAIETEKSKKESLKYLKRRKKNRRHKKSEIRKSTALESKDKTLDSKKVSGIRNNETSKSKRDEQGLTSGKKSRKRKKKSRKISEPLIKSKKKKSLSRVKRRIRGSEDEDHGESIYTDPRIRNRDKEHKKMAGRKDPREKRKRTRKASRSKEALGKLKQITKKKTRGKARSKAKKAGLKRYASVNTSKNPLLEMNLDGINPRNTLKASTNLDKGKAKKTFNFQEIQNTGLLAYQSNRERNTGNSRKRKMPKAEQPSLYQRQNSREGSSVEVPDKGVYKNLYSGKHERNILEISSQVKAKQKKTHQYKPSKLSR